jgi:acyl-CoA thioesterase FadM
VVPEPGLELAVERQAGDTVLFRGGAAELDLRVLTFPLRLTRGPERIVALIVQAPIAAEPAAVEGAEPPSVADKYGFDPSVHALLISHDSPNGEPALTLRFPLTFRDCANLSRTLYFSHYSIWLGKLRELVIQPVYSELAREFASGRWGMVTNYSETRIFDAARADGVIEGRIWLDEVSGQFGSTQDLHYEWKRVLPDGRRERIAWSKMQATWVEILSHGVVEARPLPDYYQQYIESMKLVGSDPRAEPLPATVDEIDLGVELFRVPPGPVNRALLAERVFGTALEDANLVGNIYFANYTLWTGRTRDHFFHDVAPEYYRGVGEQGELRCLYHRIDHLREAMPFERIAVRMSLEALHERGVRLRCDYFRVTPDGGREKLAHGQHVVGWFALADGSWSLTPLPEVFRAAVLARAEGAA